jgi:hypothetical protein
VRHELPGAGGIGDAGGRDRHCPDQTAGVDQQVPLAAGDFFSPRRSRGRRRGAWP